MLSVGSWRLVHHLLRPLPKHRQEAQVAAKITIYTQVYAPVDYAVTNEPNHGTMRSNVVCGDKLISENFKAYICSGNVISFFQADKGGAELVVSLLD